MLGIVAFDILNQTVVDRLNAADQALTLAC